MKSYADRVLYLEYFAPRRYRWNGRQSEVMGLSEQLLPDVWRSNAQLTFGPSDDSWAISGFVRNIENNRTVAFSSTTPLANALVAGTLSPRTYGARGSFRF